MAFVRRPRGHYRYHRPARGFGDHYLHKPRRGLGDDVDATPMTETEWRLRMLAAQEATVAEAARFREQDKLTRNMQLVATVSIPLFAIIWRHILEGRKID